MRRVSRAFDHTLVTLGSHRQRDPSYAAFQMPSTAVNAAWTVVDAIAARTARVSDDADLVAQLDARRQHVHSAQPEK